MLPPPDSNRLCDERDAIKSEQLTWFEKSDLIICSAPNSAPITHDAERLRNETGASYTSQSTPPG
ncbi:MAG: hypothetical protein RL077_2462 [Verrucomicrobiota bacterium]